MQFVGKKVCVPRTDSIQNNSQKLKCKDCTYICTAHDNLRFRKEEKYSEVRDLSNLESEALIKYFVSWAPGFIQRILTVGGNIIS